MSLIGFFDQLHLGNQVRSKIHDCKSPSIFCLGVRRLRRSPSDYLKLGNFCCEKISGDQLVRYLLPGVNGVSL